ncbi:MAG: hypothetical protein IH900_01035 [Proteobacteria bacterium]|nr:hypothetical protein [Pseudomonadota bacterium]
MTGIRRVLLAGLVGVALGAGALGAGAPAQAAAGQRVKVTGEVIDSWCYLTEIMYPEGTAHHQCALWCAAGGIPVGILADDGTVYTVLKIEGDSTSNANPKVLEIQSRRVTVEGDLYARDGINYLLIDRVVDDQGIVKLTHDDYGIQPFGE